MITAKITAKLEGLENLTDELLDAVDFGIADATDRGFQLSQELVTRQSFDRGVLLQSGHILTPRPLERIIEYSALHAIYIEWGATYTDKMPPLKVIYEWVRRHKLTPRDRESLTGIKRWLMKKGIINSMKTRDSDWWALAFYIAKDIKEYGLEPRPYMRPAAEEIKAHLADDVTARLKEVTGR